MSKFSGEYPYDDYWIYAPIYHQKEGRNYACLVSKSDHNKRTTISYAKYVISIFLKRELEEWEEVDHINENRLDDVLENLSVISSVENRNKYINSRVYHTMVDMNCPNCGEFFTKNIHDTFISKNGVFTACSRHCAGVLRKKLQMGMLIDFSKNVIKIYKNKTIA